MNQLNVNDVIKTQKRASLPRSFKKESNIINRREIEPLFDKARQILSYYSEAVNVKAAVQGAPVSPWSLMNQMRFCEACTFKSYCKKLDQDSPAEARQNDGTQVYSCPAGFINWTSPLYRKGRFAGNITAGQFSRSEGENSPERIQAMAQLLEICALEISEKEEDPGCSIRRMVGLERKEKNAFKARGKSGSPGQNPAKKQEENPEYLMEKERLLLAAFRRGDIDTGKKILSDFMNYLTSDDTLDFEILRFRAIELMVLLSRAAMGKDKDINVLLEANNRYLRRIKESKTIKELSESLHCITERMAGNVFAFQGIRHASVLRKAERYIWDNYTRKISLEEISKFSGLSAPYFSTIFKEEMGENLSAYLNRLRVEKAANLLMATGKSLNEIAESCGFEDQSWFSKIFKKFTGISPGKFRDLGNGTTIHKTIRSKK